MFQMKFDTDNAGFDGDDLARETARILRELADKIDAGAHLEIPGRFRNVMDGNGNIIGTWKLHRM